MVASVHSAEGQQPQQHETAEIRWSSEGGHVADENPDTDHDCSSPVVDSISSEFVDTDVTIPLRRDSEELRTRLVPEIPGPDVDGMTQAEEDGFECETLRTGNNHQTSDFCDRPEVCGSYVVAGSIGKDRRLQCKTVPAGVQSAVRTRTVEGEPRASRVCDDCKAGSTRWNTRIDKDSTGRWNSPASSSQQSNTRNRRTTKSGVRPSQSSIADQTLNSSNPIHTVSKSRNVTNANHQRTAKDKQPRCRDNSAACSPTSAKNNTAANSATSGRRDVTSGQVTRRSRSAKTATSVTQVPGRRCQSSDDRRQRQKNSSVRDQELTPFHRKCSCAARNAQGQMTSEGQTGSSSRTPEHRALPNVVSKPWARTLRDYGDSEKSPSPVRSRRSTPDSSNCRRTSTATARTGSDVVSGQDLPANRRQVPSTRTSRPSTADLGTTKSDSTLVQQRRPDRRIGSAGSAAIPASSSLGAMPARRVLNTASRNIETETRRERKTAITVAQTRQLGDKTTNDNRFRTSARVPDRKTTAVSAQKESKRLPLTAVSSHHNAVKTVDLRDLSDLENLPSKAPTATSVQPEVFQRSRVRRQQRLAGNDDVSSVTSLVTKKPARQRSHVSDSDDIRDSVRNLSATSRRAKIEDNRPAEAKSGNKQSVTSPATHRDIGLDRHNAGQSLSTYDGAVELTLITNDTKTLSPCCHPQPPEETASINDTSCELSKLTDTDIRDIKSHSSCDAGNLQHSNASINCISVTLSVQENNDLRGIENPVETARSDQEEKSSNHFPNTIKADCEVSVTQRHERNNEDEVRNCCEQRRDTRRRDKVGLSYFHELETERDFEFMDEILSCTSSELYRFVTSPDHYFSEEPNTRSISTPVDNLLGQVTVCGPESTSSENPLAQHDHVQQIHRDSGRYIDSFAKNQTSETVGCSSCPISATEVPATMSTVAGLLYTVNSVTTVPVIEVAKNLNQHQRLSSPRLSHYVAETRHKVDEVSAEEYPHLHYRHRHVAGSEKRHEDVVDFSPSSDEVVLGSPDTSTKCSLSSPSGSQLSQDSCRWRSTDDSTLVADPERRDGSASNATLRAVDLDDFSSAAVCDATTASFASSSNSSPGISGLARFRPRIPARRSRHFERSWSPDLSCFRQPRSPDPPDENVTQRFWSWKISEEYDVTNNASRSRLLRRLLFNGRLTEAVKLPGSSTTSDCVHHSDVIGVDCASENGSKTDGTDERDDDLLVDVRRYRSLSRRYQEHDRGGANDQEHCPSTPPLAVFLSSEDITSTIFPLRHATSEPASTRSRAPFNSSPLSVRNSPAVGCQQTRWSKRHKERRPLSECFGTALAVKLAGTLDTITLTPRVRSEGNLLLPCRPTWY